MDKPELEDGVETVMWDFFFFFQGNFTSRSMSPQGQKEVSDRTHTKPSSICCLLLIGQLGAYLFLSLNQQIPKESKPQKGISQ